jgi:hypothetical protein
VFSSFSLLLTFRNKCCAAQLKSLQELIQERKSAVTIAAHEKHVKEYSVLVQLLQTKFGIELSTLSEEDTDGSDDESDTGNTTLAQHARKKKNNNAEEAGAGSGNVPPASQRRLLESQFQAIDLEVKHSHCIARRAKEDEVSGGCLRVSHYDETSELCSGLLSELDRC